MPPIHPPDFVFADGRAPRRESPFLPPSVVAPHQLQVSAGIGHLVGLAAPELDHPVPSAADDLDLPLGAPDSLRIRSLRAWLARRRLEETDTLGLLLLERRRLYPDASRMCPMFWRGGSHEHQRYEA